MTDEGHAALIVEDHAETAHHLAELLRARGDRPYVAATVEDALRLLEEIDPCYVLVDQQLPHGKGGIPVVSGGERVVIAARKGEPRRVDDTWHVRSIIVVTGFASDPDFVSKMYDLGADAFMEKPVVGPGEEKLLAKIRTCLERAQRAEHAGCGRFLRTAAKGLQEKTITLRIDGARDGARSRVVISGTRRLVPEGPFTSLVLLIAAHVRAPGSWTSREALYISRARNATTRVREAFAGLVPEGFEPLEADRSGQFRLNPAVVVEAVDWVALRTHPNANVKKIAKEMAERNAAR